MYYILRGQLLLLDCRLHFCLVRGCDLRSLAFRIKYFEHRGPGGWTPDGLCMIDIRAFFQLLAQNQPATPVD
jgi:hypothetical protein